MHFLCVVSMMAAAILISPAEKKDVPMFTPAGHTTDDLAVVKTRVEAREAVLLDVRENDEWAEGHLKTAALMPLSEIRSGTVPEKYQRLLPKDKPIYVHCQAGGRVLKCAEVLKKEGYDIRPLKAGYAKLVEFGFEKAMAQSE